MIFTMEVTQYCMVPFEKQIYTYRGKIHLEERSSDDRDKQPGLDGQLGPICNSR